MKEVWIVIHRYTERGYDGPVEVQIIDKVFSKIEDAVTYVENRKKDKKRLWGYFDIEYMKVEEE